jgi:putative ABC transport system permease protein
MESWLRDIRVSLRMLRQSPGFTTVAVLCLALGIGANTTVYSIVEGVLLRPFPFADPDRIVALDRSRAFDPSPDTYSYPDFFDLRQQATTVGPIAAWTQRSLTLGTIEPERVEGFAVSAELFPLLGVKPALGRGLTAEDDRPGAPCVILLSNDTWRRTFQADPALVGGTLQVNGGPCTVAGVMPPRFQFPEGAQAWEALTPVVHGDLRNQRELVVLARLRPGVDRAQAGAEMDAFAARQAALYPAIDTGWEAPLRPLREMLLDKRARRFVVAVLGAVLFVLLIACANLANLQLARANDRRRDIAVHLAFGAGRGRIARQLLIESLLLAFAGAALGWLLAAAALRVFVAAFPAEHPLPYWIRFDLDGPVLAATIAAAVGSGLLFGLVPVLTATRSVVHDALKEGGRMAAASRGRQRLRGTLVVVEVAMALMLLAGASLFTQSFLKLTHERGGFDPEPLLTLRIYLPGGAYDDDGAKTRRVEDVLRRIEALPGVERAGAANLVPLTDGGEGATVEIAGQPVEKGHETSVFYTGITAHYFAALGAPLLEGRSFSDQEAGAATPLAVVNSTFAHRFWDSQSPLGQRFRLADSVHPEWFTVIGVVADFKGEKLNRPVRPSAYLPFPYQAIRNTGILVRSRASALHLMPLIRRQIRAADPGLPVFGVATMEQLRRSGWWAERLFNGMFGAFGAIALALAAIGIYGVLSYSVSQRRREIGVRMALGAHQGHVLRLVMGQALLLALAGIAAGTAGALSLTRVLGLLLYEVSPTDPATFAGTALFLGCVAALASALPAWRALDADPLEALRQE